MEITNTKATKKTIIPIEFPPTSHEFGRTHFYTYDPLDYSTETEPTNCITHHSPNKYPHIETDFYYYGYRFYNATMDTDFTMRILDGG